MPKDIRTDDSAFLRSLVDALASHIAVLDDTGEIVETNSRWRRFGRDNGLSEERCSRGNYLAVCRAAADMHVTEGVLAWNGIREVLGGIQDEFFLVYPCHSRDRLRWFTMRVLPFLIRGNRWAIVSHDDITSCMLAQEALQQTEIELRRQRQAQEESNIALKVLLQQREEEQRQLEEKVQSRIRELVLPYVEKLREADLPPRETTLVNIIEGHLRDMMAPAMNRLDVVRRLLTPQEMEVASLIRAGKSTKEIASVCRLAPSTISFHRKSLRRKLGLSSRRDNLQSYLASLM